MADTFSKEKRSDIMSRIKGKNTRPELLVRSLLHRLGYRFRLHRKDLPGKPDIVLPKHKKIIFVHGCFWHGHPDCKRSTLPKSNAEFWRKKIQSNIDRDDAALRELSTAGWKTLIVWQCKINNFDELIKTLTDFLKPTGKTT